MSGPYNVTTIATITGTTLLMVYLCLLLTLQLMAGQIALVAGPSATWRLEQRGIWRQFDVRKTWNENNCIHVGSFKLEKIWKHIMTSSWHLFHNPSSTPTTWAKMMFSWPPMLDELFGLQITACIGTAHIESRGQAQLQLCSLPAVRREVTPARLEKVPWSRRSGCEHDWDMPKNRGTYEGWFQWMGDLHFYGNSVRKWSTKELELWLTGEIPTENRQWKHLLMNSHENTQ